MGAIVLDASKVNSYVLPNLVKSKNTMQDAYSTSQSLRNSLPSSFTYRSTINDIVNQLYNIKREISDIDTMISKKVEKAKTIENRNDNRVSGIAKAASSIGSIVGTIGGAAIGARTGGVVGAAAGAYVGNKIGSAAGKTIVDTGAKIVKSYVSLCKKFWTGVQKLSAKVARKVTSLYSKILKKAIEVPKFLIQTRAKISNKIVSAVEKVTGWDLNWIKKINSKVSNFVVTAIDKVGNFVNKVYTGIGNWLGDLIENPWATLKKTAASIANTVVGLIEGLASFGEAIYDAGTMLKGAYLSLYTGIYDGFQALNGLITGKEWQSATKALWGKVIMPEVSKTYVADAFNSFYEGSLGKALESNSYSIFKRDGGVVYSISKGVGYYAPIVALNAIPGVGPVLAAVTAGTGQLGKSGEANYNNEMKKLLEANPNLTQEEIQNIIMNESMGRILLQSSAEAVVEGATMYFAAGAKTGYTNSLGKQALTKSGAIKSIAEDKLKEEIAKAGAEVLKKSAMKRFIATGLSAGVKTTKAYNKELLTVLSDGDFNWSKANEEAAATIIAEYAADGFANKIKISPKTKAPENLSEMDILANNNVNTSPFKEQFFKTTNAELKKAVQIAANKTTIEVI